MGHIRAVAAKWPNHGQYKIARERYRSSRERFVGEKQNSDSISRACVILAMLLLLLLIVPLIVHIIGR